MKKYILFFISFLFVTSASANIIGADTQNFNPDYGHNDYVTVRSSATLPKGHLNFTLFADYSSETLPAYPLDSDPYTVSNKADLGDTAIYSHFGVGLGITDWLDVGFSLPAILNQEIDNPDPRGEFAENGMVEMRFAAKARLLKFEDNKGGFAVQGSVGINQIEANPFIGEDPGPSLNLEFILDRQIGNIMLSGNLGYRMRDPGAPNKDIPDGSGQYIIPNDDILIASVGVAVGLTEKFSVIGELWGAWPDDGKYGGIGVYRDGEIYEGLAGLKYTATDKLNIHAGLTTGINHGLSTPTYRGYAGVNWMFGPLWNPNPTPKVKKAKKIEEELSYYDPGFRQGYMAGFGIGPYANLGANYGEELDGGVEFPEGFYDGYMASGTPFPEDVVAKTPYAKCYRTGFQGKIGNGPAEGQGLGYGSVLGLGIDCEEGYDQGWTDAPDREAPKESFYNPGYREGYKAGHGIGPYAGLGAAHGATLDGGPEFDIGFRDGYEDASGPFPGQDDTRIYGQGYRLGFQGKLGQGPGAGTGPSFGSSINPEDPYPLGWEHGWIDAPVIEQTPEPDPVVLDANDGNAFDNMEVKKEESFRLENVHFDVDSYRLRSESREVLDSLARHLQKGTGFKRLIIEGHTDSDGDAIYNERLSLQRAMSVEKYLTDVHGLDGDKIIADGYGERKPVAPNDSRANKQKNRRVEFRITRD